MMSRIKNCNDLAQSATAGHTGEQFIPFLTAVFEIVETVMAGKLGSEDSFPPDVLCTSESQRLLETQSDWLDPRQSLEGFRRFGLQWFDPKFRDAWDCECVLGQKKFSFQEVCPKCEGRFIIGDSLPWRGNRLAAGNVRANLVNVPFQLQRE
jgi:hypothetical protein